jgi:nucleotide-binding universal stress UspA family protein
MKILWATDFSLAAQGAGQVAGELARLTGGSVDVAHVLAPNTTDILALSADAVLMDEEAARRAEARTAEEARRLEEAGLKAAAWVGQGDVASALRDRAAETGADLIVLGSTHRSAFGRWMLASGAARLIDGSERPVMIVPEGVTTIRAADGGLQVMAALDGRPGGRAIVEFGRRLRATTPCDLTFVRLYWPPEECRRLGLHGPRDFLQGVPEVVADLERGLSAQVGILPGSGRTSFAVEAAWGEPAGRLFEVAHQRKPGLLVVGAETRHGWGLMTHVPVAEHVARQAAELPVVFVPPLAAGSPDSEVPIIMNVLAATDLSPAGNRAVRFAYALLAGQGGVVELCYVHERALASPPYAYESDQGQLSPAARAQLEERLRALIPPEERSLGITTNLRIIDGGKAGPALVQAAERLWVHAIVVGSRGRGGAARALLGSVSDHVVHHAARPVFVVPGQPQ